MLFEILTIAPFFQFLEKLLSLHKTVHVLSFTCPFCFAFLPRLGTLLALSLKFLVSKVIRKDCTLRHILQYMPTF